MSRFLVATEESVRGFYTIEADNEEEARQMFENNPRKAGEQIDYSAYDIQVIGVEPDTSQ